MVFVTLLRFLWNTKIIENVVSRFVIVISTFVFSSTTDVNECARPNLNDCHNKAFCININASYECQCRSGYTGDGRNCIGTYVHVYH